MTRLTLLLPLAALALTSCDTPDFAVFPQLAAKNRVGTPGDPRGGTSATYGDDALLSSIPPAPISAERGGVDIPTDTTPSAPYDPNKKISLEQLTETRPLEPTPSPHARPVPPANSTAGQERITEPQPVHWFGRPNAGNTAAIPVGPTKKP